MSAAANEAAAVTRPLFYFPKLPALSVHRARSRMLLASVSFVPHIDHEEAELVSAAELYLGTLQKNGQICGEYVAGWTDGVYLAFVQLSHRKASDSRYLSQWGRRSQALVTSQFGGEPIWELLDDEASARTATWKSAKTLYVFTHSFHAASAVIHGGRGTPLPLQLLPISDRLREELFDFSESYRGHDRVFLDGSALEISAYEQLADPTSDLAGIGRELTQHLEAATGKPTYFYLLRHWAHPTDEDDRPCPSCGAPWRETKSPMPSREPFHQFHFRCEACRLVSHRGVVFEDNDRWRIGTYDSTSDGERTEQSAENE